MVYPKIGYTNYREFLLNFEKSSEVREEKICSAVGGEKKRVGAKKTAPKARKKEIGNANRKLLAGITSHAERAPVRLWRISCRDFVQNEFGFCPKHTANF